MVDARKFILEVRMRMRLTQEELADAIGCSARTVKRWEKGETEPSCSITLYIIRLCGKKGINIDDLLFCDSTVIVRNKISPIILSEEYTEEKRNEIKSNHMLRGYIKGSCR